MRSEKESSSEEIAESAREEKVSELDILRQSLEEKKKEAESFYAQLLLLKADFENFRKRSEKDKHNHRMWGKEEILLKQVNVLDILKQASKSIVPGADIESISKGMEMIIQEFVKMLLSEDVKEIDCAGKKFDPSFHEAVDHAVSEKEEGTIIEVLQNGYMFKDRLLRPARVKVSGPKGDNMPQEKK